MELQTLKLPESGDIEVHLRAFQAIKHQIEEQGIKLDGDVYKAALIISLPQSYHVVVSIIELQDGMTTERAANWLLEESRRRNLDGCRGEN